MQRDHFKSVPGHLYPEEGWALQEAARRRVVLEVGGLYGRSTCAMIPTADRVLTIDHGKGSPDGLGQLEPVSLAAEWRRNTQGLADLWQIDHRQAYRYLNPGAVQLAFYDGNHEPEHVQVFCDWLRLHVAYGAPFPPTVAFHDYGKPEWKLGTNVVDTFIAKSFPDSTQLVGSLLLLTYNETSQ